MASLVGRDYTDPVLQSDDTLFDEADLLRRAFERRGISHHDQAKKEEYSDTAMITENVASTSREHGRSNELGNLQTSIGVLDVAHPDSLTGASNIAMPDTIRESAEVEDRRNQTKENQYLDTLVTRSRVNFASTSLEQRLHDEARNLQNIDDSFDPWYRGAPKGALDLAITDRTGVHSRRRNRHDEGKKKKKDPDTTMSTASLASMSRDRARNLRKSFNGLGVTPVDTVATASNLAVSDTIRGNAEVGDRRDQANKEEHPDPLVRRAHFASTSQEQGPQDETRNLQNINDLDAGYRDPPIGSLDLSVTDSSRGHAKVTRNRHDEGKKKKDPDTMMSTVSPSPISWDRSSGLDVMFIDTLATSSSLAVPDTIREHADAGERRDQAKRKGLGYPNPLASRANFASTSRGQRPQDEARNLQNTNEVIDTLAGASNRWKVDMSRALRKEAEQLEVELTRNNSVREPETPETLTSEAKPTPTYQRLGQWADKEKHQAQVMNERISVLGAEHPDTLMSMHNLASTYWEQRRWEEAENLQAQVAEKRASILGEEHRETLMSKANLASTYCKQGRRVEAEKLQTQVMEMSTRVLGPEHPDTLLFISNLAATYYNQERWKDAEDLHRQVLEARTRTTGAHDPRTLVSMHWVALATKMQGRHEEAMVTLLKVISLQKETIGSQHPETLTAISNLAEWQRERDQ